MEFKSLTGLGSLDSTQSHIEGLGKAGDDFAMVGFGGEVGPFVWVVFPVVKFLAAVAVSDVAPVCTTNGVVSFVKRGDGKTIADGFWIRELRAK